MKWLFPYGKSDLKETLMEKRPLPTGVDEFHEWSNRVIQGACITAEADSQKFALANILINLGPTVAFESDAYFINCLRKTAVNQVADAMRTEIRDTVKERLAIQERQQAEALEKFNSSKEQKNQAATTAPRVSDGEVLENPGLSGAQ